MPQPCGVLAHFQELIGGAHIAREGFPTEALD
jgi:hypothetical protein